MPEAVAFVDPNPEEGRGRDGRCHDVPSGLSIPCDAAPRGRLRLSAPLSGLPLASFSPACPNAIRERPSGGPRADRQP
ncbi:protein of unknown function [Rhodovastum atsumiense]|nr:protein of unknown function [Rhodovastum atsumiense]